MLGRKSFLRAGSSRAVPKRRPLRLAIERLEDRSLLTGAAADTQPFDWTQTQSLANTLAAPVPGSDELVALEATSTTVVDPALVKIPSGNFSLETFDVAQATMGDGQKAEVLQIVVTPRRRFTEPTIELATIGLLFEESPGDPLSDADANSLISTVQVYRDRGNHLFDPLDTLVTTVHTLELDEGYQSVVLPIDEPSTQVEFSFSRTFYIVVELTGNATEQSVGQFRVTHVTEGPYASTAVRRISTNLEGGSPLVQTIPLELGPVGNVSSSIIQLDATRPTIADVLVSGSGWSTSLMDHLHATGLGSGGYSIIADDNLPQPTIAWDNVDQIRVLFSESVIVELADLMLIGSDGDRYFAATLTTDAPNETDDFFATWTFKRPVGPESLMGFLDDAIEDIAGNVLVGGSETGAAGQAHPAGSVALDMVFPLDVLPGDANGDGRVDAGDYTLWANNYGHDLESGLIQADFNADGAFTNDDYQIWAGHFGRTLSRAQFAPAAAQVFDGGTGIIGAAIRDGLRMTAPGTVSAAAVTIDAASSNPTELFAQASEPTPSAAQVQGGAKSPQAALDGWSYTRVSRHQAMGQDQQELEGALAALRPYATHGTSQEAWESLLEACFFTSCDTSLHVR